MLFTAVYNSGVTIVTIVLKLLLLKKKCVNYHEVILAEAKPKLLKLILKNKLNV